MTFTDTDLYTAADRLISRAAAVCDSDTATVVRQAMESLIEMLTAQEPDTGLGSSNRPIEWSDVFTDTRGL